MKKNEFDINRIASLIDGSNYSEMNQEELLKIKNKLELDIADSKHELEKGFLKQAQEELNEIKKYIK